MISTTGYSLTHTARTAPPSSCAAGSNSSMNNFANNNANRRWAFA